MSAQLEPLYRKAYILGGNARFTLVSPKSGLRITYRVEKAENNPELYFVSVLVGPDNTRDYAYLGTLTERGGFKHGSKSKISRDAPSTKAFAWLSDNLYDPRVEVWHLGKCSRCGRDLTDPASIQRGLGPVCAERQG